MFIQTGEWYVTCNREIHEHLVSDFKKEILGS